MASARPKSDLPCLNGSGIGKGSVLLVVPRGPRGGGPPSDVFCSSFRFMSPVPDLTARTGFGLCARHGLRNLEPVTRDFTLFTGDDLLGLTFVLGARLGSYISVLAEIYSVKEDGRIDLRLLNYPRGSAIEGTFGTEGYQEILGTTNLGGVPALCLAALAPSSLESPAVSSLLFDMRCLLGQALCALTSGVWHPFENHTPRRLTSGRCDQHLGAGPLVLEGAPSLFFAALTALLCGYYWNGSAFTRFTVSSDAWAASYQNAASPWCIVPLDQNSLETDSRALAVLVRALDVLGPYMTLVLSSAILHVPIRDLLRETLARFLRSKNLAHPGYSLSANLRDAPQDHIPSAGLWSDDALEPVFGDLWTYVSTDIQAHRYNLVRSARSFNQHDQVRSGLFNGELVAQPLLYPLDTADIQTSAIAPLMTPRRDSRAWERRSSGSASPQPSRALPSSLDATGADLNSGPLRAPSPNRELIRSDLSRARDTVPGVLTALQNIATDYIDTDGYLPQLASTARVQNRQGF